MGLLTEILSRIDPRLRREEDLSSLELPDLGQSTIVLKLLWRRHEEALQRERILRFVLWLVILTVAVAVAL
jgi:hypothetical protein